MDVDRFKRVMLSLPDASLRVAWLASELAGLGSAASAALLNAVMEQNEAADPGAHEALLSIALVLVDPDNRRIVEMLREEAEAQGLFSLQRLTRRAPPPSIHVPSLEELRVPDYGTGRELSLGERKSLARRPDRRSFE